MLRSLRSGRVVHFNEHSSRLIVHGEVSLRFVQAQEFQAAWSSWLPDRYTSIDIISDSEQEQSSTTAQMP